LRCAAIALLAFLAGGCDRMVVLNPKGPIADAERGLMIDAFTVMMLVVVPIIVMVFWFAWRYRARGNARYEPTWAYSVKVDAVVWLIPALIVIAVAVLLWRSTHHLDPYREIASANPPLDVQVVAQDWKWLFIYPEQGVASVNQLAIPAGRPISLRITSDTVINSFYVPALAGQIYAMAGMETQLNAVINKPGVYEGFSANYSGAGFSDMRFKFHGMNQADFDKWVQNTKASTAQLDRANYSALEKPSIREKVRHYGSVDADLYDAIVNRCVDRNATCIKDMMAEDAARARGATSVALAAERTERRMAQASTGEVCITPETKKN
jgi:cytochrome o ubiquinol oxidase subunit 2